LAAELTGCLEELSLPGVLRIGAETHFCGVLRLSRGEIRKKLKLDDGNVVRGLPCKDDRAATRDIGRIGRG